MIVDDFFTHVLNDTRLVELLKMFDEDIWNKLNNEERLSVYKNIIERFNLIYPECGELKFSFVFQNNSTGGESSDDLVSINIVSSLKESKFDILSTCLHELRHFYQNYACGLYERTGDIHDMFKDMDFEGLYKNNMITCLGRSVNYINYSDKNYVEYAIQPVEYDAELFAKQFMRLFSDNFFVNKKDIDKCLKTNNDFEKVYKLFEEDKFNIIKFSEIYNLNIRQYYENNESVFEEDKKTYEKYIKNLDHIDSLCLKDVYILCAPCFWFKYDNEIKNKLLNRILVLNDCDLFVECNGKCTNVNRKILVNNDSFGIMEFLFNEIANFQINRILKNKDKENLKLVEKQIILNLADENNIIKEEENPLFYNIQPYMMYKNLYISECFNELFSSIFSIFKDDDNYFEEYVQYCKKYDVDAIVKKVEILTGETFAKVYDKLVGDMQKIKTRQ